MNLNKNNGDHIGGQVFIGLSISFPFFGFMIFELFSRINYNSKKCLIKVKKKNCELKSLLFVREKI